MLGVRQPLISAWEAGRHQPSPKMYFKFSRLPLDYKDQRWLAEQAGADLKTFETIADRLRKQRHERPAPPDEIVRILPMPKIEGEGPDLIFSAQKLPHPYLTQYVHVRDDFMKPQFGREDILVVDTSETDPWKLEEGACVAVYRSPEHAAQQSDLRKKFEGSHPREEVEERKRQMSFPYSHVGLFVGWLHEQIEAYADGKLGFFFLEAPWIREREMLSARQPHHPPDAEIIDASGLTVLGRVIAWLHCDQGPRVEPQGE
jgi:transcriptional regulator with XRE-family HTH domain